jgi:hypothetical protein
VDDFPRRISPEAPTLDEIRYYDAFVDARAARERFARSGFVRALWPEELVSPTLARFEEQRVVNDNHVGTSRVPVSARFPALYDALVHTSSRTLPLLLAGSDPHEQAALDRAVARGEAGSLVDFLLGVRALSERDYAAAARRFDRVAEEEPGFTDIARFRGIALCIGGDAPRGTAAVAEARQSLRAEDPQFTFWSGLEDACRAGRPPRG